MGKPRIAQEKINGIFDLRQKGHSVPEIHKLLKLPKSTVLRYCREVEILPEFKQRWLDRRNASKIISDKAWQNVSKFSEELISSVNEKELKILGAALYWAEGAKRNLNFINSDPEMIKVFIYILVNAYKVPLDSLKISLRIFEDVSKIEALKFWSNITGVQLNGNTFIDVIKGSKMGKLPYGMCRVNVKKGGLLLKTFFAINKRVISLISPRSSTDRAVAS